MRVLLADDHDIVRHAMARTLRVLGHQVTECADGQEALEQLQESSFDLVLMDRSMPRLSGTGFLERLRLNPGLRGDAVVVIVSAWSGEERSQMFELGAADVLPKPFLVEDLDRLIQVHFPTRD